ncbi:HypC/HybG/HupF family hydrogenase formation chaperone [Acidiferrobacter thiooxydans]|uniref:HypC/HybG/HupF family hydrogenase formation chaperone n=1 Tax=Acidiferrobacter thiooxydans TaxID=163359 RepID=A0A368HHD1_9GAMM|nr:HypC/HybG/HupF family hydrogenase formation chaperone [Acidiferrobacter thiooxydans]RCN58782.1 HypC/HybG/HupF family hydrogenase formation chaperone [Acidiferrobacter thiooxydans]
MCLAVPMRVERVLADDLAVVEIGGVRKTVSLALVDGVAEGDYVIVHVGFALTRLNADEARKTLDLFAEIAQVAGTGSLEGP